MSVGWEFSDPEWSKIEKISITGGIKDRELARILNEILLRLSLLETESKGQLIVDHETHKEYFEKRTTKE